MHFSIDGHINGSYEDATVGAVAEFQQYGTPSLIIQTRGKIQKDSSAQQALVSYISKQNRTNHKDHQNCLLACFLSQEEPKNISQALQDESWVEAMQEELLQFQNYKSLDFCPSKHTPIESNKPLVKDEDVEDVDVHVFISMIGSLDYLTAFKARHHKDWISWQCKKQTIVANSTTEAEYVAAANCLFQRSFRHSDTERLSRSDEVLKLKNFKKDATLKLSKSTNQERLHVSSSIAHFLHLISLNRSRLTTLIFSSPTTINSSTMAALESCPKHNMVAFLEKTDGNAEFYEIIDFLKRSSIHYALIVSLVVSTIFVEQFWMTAKSKTINNVRYITATVAGKPVLISEALIRSDLQFNDAAGIDVLPNPAIFDTIQLMGFIIFSKLIFDGMMRHLDAKKKFVMYPRFIPVFLTNQLKNVPVPLDHFPINALTTKVFSFMVKKGKKISRNVTPLFPSMLAQPTEDEGAVSERPSETQPTPSSSHPSEDPIEPQPDPSLRPSSSNPIPDSIPEGSGGNHGGQSSSDRSLSGNEDGLTLQSVYDLCVSLCKQVTTQAAQIKDLKSQIKQLKKKAKPVISHHNAWIKSVSMKKRLARKKSLKKKLIQKESVSKQGRKPAKSEPIVHKDPAFDDLDDIVDDAIDYMETEDA
ncbi:hypothetical protein Tco_0073804 [Tanacetum coccineum]